MVSIAREPLLEKADSLSVASFAFTLKYHVPSAREGVCVNEAVVAGELLTPEINDESVDHSNIYDSVLCKPAPESVEAVHVHVGVVSDVGEVAEGVPGVVGDVASTVKFGVVALNATHEEQAVSSQPFTCHLYPVASVRVATVLVAVNAVEE